MTDPTCRQAFEAEWIKTRHPVNLAMADGQYCLEGVETAYKFFRAAYRISEGDRVDAECWRRMGDYTVQHQRGCKEGQSSGCTCGADELNGALMARGGRG